MTTSKIEETNNSSFNQFDNVNFQSYIDAVKAGTIAWEFFVQLMEDLAITMNRQKLLISILLKEFKNYMDKEDSLDFTIVIIK